ncbi:hypothetical protein C8T65DRAFT_666571 [Cerioporus squamosus]|nr:hypothetical protein C8T65DRAFT_666571 [Cerioporus squamosus]
MPSAFSASARFAASSASTSRLSRSVTMPSTPFSTSVIRSRQRSLSRARSARSASRASSALVLSEAHVSSSSFNSSTISSSAAFSSNHASARSSATSPSPSGGPALTLRPPPLTRLLWDDDARSESEAGVPEDTCAGDPPASLPYFSCIARSWPTSISFSSCKRRFSPWRYELSLPALKRPTPCPRSPRPMTGSKDAFARAWVVRSCDEAVETNDARSIAWSYGDSDPESDAPL